MMNDEKMEMLLRIVEHPELFDDSEIERFLDDEECRGYYELMVMAEEGFRRRKYDDAMLVRTEASSRVSAPRWRKVSAVAAGVVMIAGIAFAAIRLAGGSGKPSLEETQAKREAVSAVAHSDAPAKEENVVSAEPRVFENESLEKVLSEMCEFYDFKVEFRRDEVRRLRLFFKWDKSHSAEEVANDLNHFDRVNIVIENRTFIVE